MEFGNAFVLSSPVEQVFWLTDFLQNPDPPRGIRELSSAQAGLYSTISTHSNEIEIHPVLRVGADGEFTPRDTSLGDDEVRRRRVRTEGRHREIKTSNTCLRHHMVVFLGEGVLLQSLNILLQS